MKIHFISTLLIGLMIVSCSNSDMLELKDNVHLIKNTEGSFDLVFDEGTEYEWIYKNVDSLAISEHYGSLFYAIGKNGTDPKWYYVTGGSLEFKKGFGNWYDAEFRKYRLKEMLHGEELYQKLKSTKQIWEEKNVVQRDI